MQTGLEMPVLAPPDQRLRVLIVGTHVAAVEAMACSGYQVQVSPDGSSALRIAVVSPPDVVLLDTHLPDMDGREITGRLNEYTGAKRPFLILVKPDAVLPDQGSEAASVDLCLVRPVKLRWLQTLLRRLQGVILPVETTLSMDAATSRLRLNEAP